jgi:hypothetical protein
MPQVSSPHLRWDQSRHLSHTHIRYTENKMDTQEPLSWMERHATSTLVQQNVSSSRHDEYAHETAISPSLQRWLSGENPPTNWCSFCSNTDVMYLPSQVEHDPPFIYNNFGGSPPLESMASFNWFNGFDPSSGQPQLCESNVRNTYHTFVPQEDIGPHAGTSLSFNNAMTRERDIVARGDTNHDSNYSEQEETLSSRSCSSEAESEPVFSPRTRLRNTVSSSLPMPRHFVCLVNVEGNDCSQRFMRPEHLRRHVKTVHESARDYRCMVPSCNKGFSRADNLKGHYLSHLERGGRPGTNEKMSLESLELILGRGRQGKKVTRWLKTKQRDTTLI